MANEITIRQFAHLALGRAEKPLHLGDIVSAYNQKMMFLKSTIENLSNSQAYMFISMLARPVVANVLGNTPSAVQSSISEFRASIEAGEASYWVQWANLWISGASAETVAPFKSLASVLESVGASIFYLSPEVSLPSIPDLDGPGITQGPGTLPPWAVIGIVGSVGALANLSVQTLPFWPGGANPWSAQDWETISAFAATGNDLLLAPAQLIPAIWQAAQGQVNNLPYAQMILLQGS